MKISLVFDFSETAKYAELFYQTPENSRPIIEKIYKNIQVLNENNICTILYIKTDYTRYKNFIEFLFSSLNLDLNVEFINDIKNKKDVSVPDRYLENMIDGSLLLEYPTVLLHKLKEKAFIIAKLSDLQYRR